MSAGFAEAALEVLEGERLEDARRILAKYPNPRSAVIPLLFLVQSIQGYVTDEGMRDVARLVGITPAQVLATGSFYTMLKKRPQGDYVISICRNITCTHLGARRLIAEVRDRLGVELNEVTSDGRFMLETAECLATCDGAPSGQINYEDVYHLTTDKVMDMIEALRRGETVTSVRGEPIRTIREISYEMAMTGTGLTALGEATARTVAGEVLPPDMAPGFRPRVTGTPAGARPRPGIEEAAESAGEMGAPEAEGEQPGYATGGSEAAAPGNRPGHPGSTEEESR